MAVRFRCIFCWYWLADLCAQQDIPFVLGHALYMKAIHGGKAHLEWAYSEAAVLFLQKNPPGQRLINRLRSKHGRPKALSILAARIGRASYFMLRRSTSSDMDRFMN